MLITFKTKSHPSITMFGNVAEELLKLAGMTGNVPTAILAKDIPALIERLEAGLEQRLEPVRDADSVAGDDSHSPTDDADAEPQVPLGRRAAPLLALLRAAAAAGTHVMVSGSGSR